MVKRKLKGFTMLEIIAVIAIIAILTGGAMGSNATSINRAKRAKVSQDFEVFKTAALNMLYEHSGLGTIPPGDLDKYFNQYIDSNSYMNDAVTELRSKDPWEAPYKVSFTQVSASESKLTFNSVGKSSGMVSFSLLAHYKDGEVRVGTAGLGKDQGTDTSDASITSGGAVSVTNMWAK